MASHRVVCVRVCVCVLLCPSAAAASSPARRAVYLGEWGQKGSQLGDFRFPFRVAVHPNSGHMFISESGGYGGNRVSSWRTRRPVFDLVYDVMTCSLRE